VPEYGHHSAPEADPATSASPLVYAIGDIHGSLQKLCDLIGRCERHADGRPAAFVFLGDYIDRGPDSAAVIDTVMNLQLRLKHRVIALKGNHEAVAIDVAGARRISGCAKAAPRRCAAMA
jgi:predicted phosphodiesterase